MKGIVFTEFLEFCENQFSLEILDNIIEKSHLPSKGIYTAVGTYDPAEMFSLVQSLSKEVNIPQQELLKLYGKHLFGVFTKHYPGFFKERSSTFKFLKNVETYIHIEVKKLYPDAELPHFEFESPKEDHLTMIYTSKRHLGDLAEGLIIGCIDYHQEHIDIKRTDLGAENGAKIKFDLFKRE
jgi:hypothetical protein